MSRVSAIPDQIGQALDRVCMSNDFRSSKRSQEFLRFIVTETVAGHQAELKERTIAIRVFHRDPSYSAAEDSIVRVQAREVRNRLARYYDAEGSAEKIRFSLPVGSYHAEIRLVEDKLDLEPMPPRSAPVPSRWSRRTVAVGLTAIIVGAIAVAVMWWSGRRTSWQEVWRPIAESRQPVLIVGGRGRHWTASKRLERLLSEGGVFPRQMKIEEKDLQRSASDMVSFENTQAMSSLLSTVHRWQVPGELRIYHQVNAAELKEHPIIFVGAYNNAMTMNLMPKLRYRFEGDGHRQTQAIIDSWHRENSWSFEKHGQDEPDFADGYANDYAMVARLRETNGAPIYVVAGIFGSGTLVAADFLTQPRYWDDVVKSAPRGWESMNFQVILKTTVVERAARPPEVITAHFWR